MKKLVIASAVAAVMASASVAADTSVYGNIRLQVESAEQISMESGKLVVGFKASEDLGNGLTGYMQLEMEHDGADEHDSGLGWGNDRSYVGLKGDFGALQLGVQSDAAGFACGGTDIFTNNSGAACGVGAVNGDLNDAVVYVKGVGDLTFVVAATLTGQQAAYTEKASADEVAAADIIIAAPASTAEEVEEAKAAKEAALAGVKDDLMHTILAAQYAAGPVSVGAQFTTLDGGDAPNAKDTTLTVIGGTYAMGDMTFGLTFADNDADDNNTAMAVAVSFANVAGGTVKIGADMGDALDYKKGGDGETVNVEFSKNLSKSVYAGVQYASTDLASGVDESADALYGYLGYNF